MLTWLADHETWFGPLRLLRYLSFRSLMAAATAFGIGLALGPWLIARLRVLKFGQHRVDDRLGGGSQAGQNAKLGTPTMGGLLIYAAVVISTGLWARPNIWVFASMFTFTGLMLAGFRDDYLKAVKKQRDGISSREKMGWQCLVTAAVLAMLLWHPDSSAKVRELWVPFLKQPLMSCMPLAVLAPFLFLVLVGSSNAVNLSDGLDGLAIGCTITVALVYALMAYAAGNVIISDYLFISHVPGAGELAVICAAMAGAGLAFLWYNCEPADVFMGDTGSLAIGGLIGTVAFLIHQPFTLVIVGGIFVMEAASVILQVGSYKLRNKRRIFLRSPIHHHFQDGGWPDSRVVIRFWILSLVFALAGLGTLKLR